jgi:Protein of unknown function (DUF2905)
MVRLLIVAGIIIVGAAVLAPAIALVDPAPIPGDFHILWNNTRLAVPVGYSLCASVVLALLYLVMKR